MRDGSIARRDLVRACSYKRNSNFCDEGQKIIENYTRGLAVGPKLDKIFCAKPGSFESVGGPHVVALIGRGCFVIDMILFP